jgi:hypothetical protein
VLLIFTTEVKRSFVTEAVKNAPRFVHHLRDCQVATYDSNRAATWSG